MFAWQLTAVEYNTEGVIINRKLSTAIKDALNHIFHLRKEIVRNSYWKYKIAIMGRLLLCTSGL